MCNSCNTTIQTAWDNLAIGQQYRTPNNRTGVNFTIAQLTANEIEITPQNIRVSRASFEATVHYLRQNNHFQNNICRIGSNNAPRLSWPLCRTARAANNNVRCINYILPILAAAEVVGINGQRPNTTWLL